jgi:hypothetical protein
VWWKKKREKLKELTKIVRNRFRCRFWEHEREKIVLKGKVSSKYESLKKFTAFMQKQKN